jgi:hypothetical protein
MGYCFVVLTAIGLTLPLVIDQAVSAPITFVGLVVMLLLAYLIFTMTSSDSECKSCGGPARPAAMDSRSACGAGEGGIPESARCRHRRYFGCCIVAGRR